MIKEDKLKDVNISITLPRKELLSSHKNYHHQNTTLSSGPSLGSLFTRNLFIPKIHKQQYIQRFIHTYTHTNTRRKCFKNAYTRTLEDNASHE